MLRSELHTIENLVAELCTIHKSPGEARSVKRPVEIVRLVASECERLRSVWTHHLFSNIKEQVIRRYIRFHHSGLISLSDKLSVDAMQPGTVVDITPQGMAVVQLIDEIVQFLQHSLDDFFEAGLTQSRYRRESEAKVYLQMTRDLEANLQRILPESSLTRAIIHSLRDQLAEFPNERISYQQSSVIYQFIITLRYYINGTEPMDEKKLFLFAYKMNMNSKRVLNWFKQTLNSPGSYTFPEAFETLSEQRSSLQPPVDPNESPLAEALLPWLRKSLGTTEEAAMSLSALPQMPLNLSVAQFSLFIRVCYRADCFSLSNAAEIIRFFTAHFTTKRQGDVSVKSFTKGFYAIDQSAAAMIRDFLQRMIAFINKTYFP